jgi:hypothetical protein
MILLSRSWLPALARDYAARVGLADRYVVDCTALVAVEAALVMLRLAPWHFRVQVGMCECAASIWCGLRRLRHGGRPMPEDEMRSFAICPVIAAPLLRLYRSLVAIGWFEQPEVMAVYDIEETPEARQTRFRRIRSEAI